MAEVKPIPEGYHTITPYLIVRDATKAIDFYKNAFGAEELFRMEMPGGKIGHAELRIGNSPFMLADEYPDAGHASPENMKFTPVSFMVYVEDVDSFAERGLKAGLTVLRPIKNQFYGDRSGTFKDPFGHTWTLGTHVENVSPAEMKRRMAEMS